MKLTFLGVGSAFTPMSFGDVKDCNWQSNMMLESNNGRKLLIDCGSDCRFSLAEQGVQLKSIDGVYISHLHADHVGGLEWLAFSNYFSSSRRLALICNNNIMRELWDNSLSGGLSSIQGKVVTLTEYFECHPVKDNQYVIWDNIKIQPIQTVHVVSGYSIKYSYGLMLTELSKSCDESLGKSEKLPIVHQMDVESEIESELESHLLKSSRFRDVGEKIFITTDTQFCPHQIICYYSAAGIIFHDCETAMFKSGVHAHYSELKTLPVEIRKKMWLYHYQPNPEFDAVADGFAGFVKKGQMFDFKDTTNGR